MFTRGLKKAKAVFRPFCIHFRGLEPGSGSGLVSLSCCGQGGFYMSAIFTRGKDFRSVKTADHLRSRWQLCCLTDTADPLRVSRIWQSGRPFHRSPRQCQQSDFASGQSECPVGYAEHPRQIRSTPKDHRTRAASMPQPFPTAVFAAVSPDGEVHSLCGVDRQFHKQRQRAE